MNRNGSCSSADREKHLSAFLLKNNIDVGTHIIYNKIYRSIPDSSIPALLENGFFYGFDIDPYGQFARDTPGHRFFSLRNHCRCSGWRSPSEPSRIPCNLFY